MNPSGTDLTTDGSPLQTMNAGIVFPGDNTNYLKGSSELLDSSTTGNSALTVIRARPSANAEEITKHYLVESEIDAKFLSIYCDNSAGNGNILKVDWYPGGAVETQSTTTECTADSKGETIKFLRMASNWSTH